MTFQTGNFKHLFWVSEFCKFLRFLIYHFTNWVIKNHSIMLIIEYVYLRGNALMKQQTINVIFSSIRGTKPKLHSTLVIKILHYEWNNHSMLMLNSLLLFAVKYFDLMLKTNHIYKYNILATCQLWRLRYILTFPNYLVVFFKSSEICTQNTLSLHVIFLAVV